MPDSATKQDEPATVRLINRAMHIAEDFLYALVALVLVALAVVVVIDAGSTLVRDSSDDVTAAVDKTLSSLLIVFILVELLGAVRATIKERRLVAEPFLLVGMIASIKEIIVVGGLAGKDMTVEDAMLKIGVLGAVILALSLAAYLLRRKEREPDE
jgi:uncharacterized membrane protein (DUF373 family)